MCSVTNFVLHIFNSAKLEHGSITGE
jgi:hypothetical protein